MIPPRACVARFYLNRTGQTYFLATHQSLDILQGCESQGLGDKLLVFGPQQTRHFVVDSSFLSTN